MKIQEVVSIDHTPKSYQKPDAETRRQASDDAMSILDHPSYDFNTSTKLTHDESDFFRGKDLGNIYNAGTNDAPQVFYPVVKEVCSLLENGKLNIHNSPELIDRLLWSDVIKLHNVFRWWGYCFTPEQAESMTRLVEQGDFSHASWSRFLDAEGKIRWRVLWDGTVYEHHLAQSQIIARYCEWDLLNVVPRSSTNENEWVIFGPEHCIALQMLWMVHDAWELGGWDVLFDLKQHGWSRDHEKASGEGVIKSLWFDEVLEQKILDIYAVDFDDTHILKPLFSLYEKMSYVYWAMRTYETIGTENEIMNPLWLIHNVLKNQITPMIQAAKWGKMEYKLRSMQQFLSDYKDTISAMFHLIESQGFKSQIESDNISFGRALDDWEAYKRSI